VALLIVGGLLAFAAAKRKRDSPLRTLLSERGRIAVVGNAEPLNLKAEGTELVPIAELPRLELLLYQGDAEAVARAITRSGVKGLLVANTEPDGSEKTSTLVQRLRRYDHVPALRAGLLAPEAALYLPASSPRLATGIRTAIGVVARGLLSGARAPRIGSFPEPLKSDGDFEIMVLLSRRGTPRLWRSARGSSMARALITAATAARRRWNKREQMMGGPLDDALKGLDIEVSLLEDDGTLACRERNFIEQAIKPEHGIGYEEGGSWRYLLPEARRQMDDRSAVAAYQRLFKRQGAPASTLDRPDVRLYRLVAVPLALSPADEGSARSQM
jgi:hypothetical protein